MLLFNYLFNCHLNIAFNSGTFVPLLKLHKLARPYVGSTLANLHSLVSNAISLMICTLCGCEF
jgi:hypothetical protein